MKSRCAQGFVLLVLAFSGLAGAVEIEDSPSVIEDSSPSLKDIIENPLKYNKVILSGIVLKRLDADTYLVQDGSAAMEVNVPHGFVPKGGLSPKNHISFEGSVSVDWDHSIEIDVDRLTFSF